MTKKEILRYQSSAPISEDAILGLLKQFKTKKVLVLGDVGIDRYTVGTVERISPEAPVPILQVQEEFLKLGLAANVADNLVTLGSRPSLVGIIGRDQDAQVFKALLKDSHISSRGLVTDSTCRTILKERLVAESQQVLRVDYENVHPVQKLTSKKIFELIQKELHHCDAFILEDYAKGLLTEELCQKVIRAAKKARVPVLVDPHLKTPVHWYQGCTLLTPNRRETEVLTGVRMTDAQAIQQAGMKLMKLAQAESLVLTLGRDGMAVFNSIQSKPLFIPTFAQEVFDVSGAGDTVISVLALALSSGSTLDEAAYLANLAAGVEVSKRGTATVSPEEIVAAYLIQANTH